MLTKPKIELHVNSIKQEKLLASPSFLTIYGGAAGGGKSFMLVMEALHACRNNYFINVVMVRKTHKQIEIPGGLWEMVHSFCPEEEIKSNKNAKKITFVKTGSTISFIYASHDKHAETIRGMQFELLLIDEATEISMKNLTALITRLRTTGGKDGYPPHKRRLGPKNYPFIIMTCNPSRSSPIFDLVYGFLNKEVSDKTAGTIWAGGRINPLLCGTEQYYIYDKKNDKFATGLTPKALKEKYGNDCEPQSLMVISANVQDNYHLMLHDPRYLKELKNQHVVAMEQLLNGDWFKDYDKGECFVKSWFKVVDKIPTNISFNKLIRAWDFAGTTVSERNPDPDSTVSVRVGYGSDGYIYIFDFVKVQYNYHDVMKLVMELAEKDGPSTTILIPQDPAQAGKEQASRYKNEYLVGYDVITSTMNTSKWERAYPVTVMAGRGKIKVKKDKWNNSFFVDLENYLPNVRGIKDDTVDALSLAVQFLKLPEIRIIETSIFKNYIMG